MMQSLGGLYELSWVDFSRLAECNHTCMAPLSPPWALLNIFRNSCCRDLEFRELASGITLRENAMFAHLLAAALTQLTDACYG